MNRNIQTAADHAGRPGAAKGDPLASDLGFASSFHTAPDMPAAGGIAGGEPRLSYGRCGNPSARPLERRIAAHAEDGRCFASGLGAVAWLFLSDLRAGDTGPPCGR